MYLRYTRVIFIFVLLTLHSHAQFTYYFHLFFFNDSASTGIYPFLFLRNLQCVLATASRYLHTLVLSTLAQYKEFNRPKTAPYTHLRAKEIKAKLVSRLFAGKKKKRSSREYIC